MKRVLALLVGLSPLALQAAIPTVTNVTPAPGPVAGLSQITITFSEDVAGVDASDLILNALEASTVTGVGDDYTFTFASVPLGPITITWAPDHGITDTEEPANPFDSTVAGEVRHYTVVDQAPPTVINRSPVPDGRLRGLSQVSVTFSEVIIGLEAADLTANGTPATALSGEGAGPYLFSFDPIGDGPVNLSWAVGHGIKDLASNALVSGDWAYTLVANARIPNLVINEFIASNRSGDTDDDQEYSDWIELLNKDNAAVNLLGWSLSDDLDEPGKFVLPERILQPGARLLIIASGKDRSPSGVAEIHTNFKLSGSGEYLGLFPPELPRQASDELAPTYPVQRNDHSYGRVNNGDTWQYFDNPTPGLSNRSSTIRGLLDPPHFSSSRGFYAQTFNLRLTASDPQAVIRFTLDGSEPTTRNGTIYANPIRVASTRIIRAAAFRSNYLPSEIVTHSYFYNESGAIRSLPIVSVSTDDSNLWGPNGIQTPGNAAQRGIAWERPASVELIRRDQSGFQENCGIRVQGGNYVRGRYNPNGGLPFSKYSFRLYFRGDYGPSMLNFPFFEGAEVKVFDRITLRAGMNDHSNPFVVDEIVRRMQIATGNVGSHGNFVNLFINGEYKGYYNATERIDDDFMRSWHGGDNGWDVIAQFGEIREGDATAWNRMRSVVSRDQTNTSNYRRSLLELDMDNFIDYLLVNVYSGTGDWPHNNWRAARERVGRAKFRFYVWDAEWSLGNLGRSVNGNTFSSELGGGSEIATMYRALVRSEEFRLRWADRAHKHMFNRGALEDRQHLTKFDQIRREMRGVLPNMGTSIRSTWIPSRRNVIIQHMRALNLFQSDEAPTIVPFGGALPAGDTVELSSSGETIYYTTDGTDPRIHAETTAAQFPLGSVSPKAFIYTEPFTINGSTIVKSRSLTRTAWSALTEAAFVQEPDFPNVRVTEIMYNPPGGSTYEFIELHNPSDRTIDLGHFSFQGITYEFSGSATLRPQQRIVLSSNDDPQSFAQRYPGVWAYGTFGGSLSNGGERLTLTDGLGNNIHSVRYNDRSGWPRSADGGGYSLVLRDYDGDANDPTSWSASPQVHGSPGGGDSAEIRPSIAFNEVLAHNQNAVPHGGEFPSFVELHNPGASSVDLADWTLSDDGNAPGKYVLPQGTSIEGGGTLVIWCATSKGAPGLYSGFELSTANGLLLLTNTAGVQIDATSYGLQIADFSLSKNGEDWILTTPTPGAPNGLPVPLASPSQLTINEWVTNRVAGEGDWLELHNQDSSHPVALRNLYLASGEAIYRYGAHSFIAPGAFKRFWADEGSGPEHLGFRLPATGGTFQLLEPNGVLIENLRHTSQAENVASGRLPDGATTVRHFITSASPGASNYLSTSSALRFSELQADFQNAGAAWVEFSNSTVNPLTLDGHSLVVGERDEGHWTFPPGLSIPANGFLVVSCDLTRPASSTPGALNTGRALPSIGGEIYFFNEVGQEIDRVLYGAQVPDLSIGFISDGSWTLLSSPTPGATNSTAALLGTLDSLSINEWLANAPLGQEDFVELHNSSNSPVALHLLRLTDDLSSAGFSQFAFPALNYLEAGGFLTLFADGGSGPGHLPFNLHALGETLRLYHSSATTILDEVSWGVSEEGVSSGRLPDGSTNYAPLNFQSPGESNSVDPAADGDGDLMADSWESRHGLNPNDANDANLDSDGDRRTNLHEFNSDTDPNDPTSFLTISSTRHDHEGFTLDFLARPGIHYTVEHSENGIDWTLLIVLDPGAFLRNESVLHESPDASGYYRLVAERAP